jgi:hypothetical protein
MATKKTATPKLTAQQKRDREYMQQTANLIATMESEQIRTNNEHYSLGMAEGEAIASYELSKMNIIQFLQWKKKTVK